MLYFIKFESYPHRFYFILMLTTSLIKIVSIGALERFQAGLVSLEIYRLAYFFPEKKVRHPEAPAIVSNDFIIN